MTPFSTFKGTLKQLSLEDIDEPARINAFQWAFPAFLDPLIETAQAGENRVHGAKARRRRYSGGLIDGLKPLPRGRYSTVCISANGYDRGGLCRELLAYAGSIVRQRVRVLDSLDSSSKVDRNWIEVWFDDQDGEILARLISDGIGSAVGFSTANPGAFAMTLYYTTRQVEIGQTIDLRLPATQDWFVQTFKPRFGQTEYKSAGSAERFPDVLPELTSRDLGGSHITDVIGHCLRRMGAAALVYPSARCDASVLIRHGALVDWYGFNLVDFRDAGELVQPADITSAIPTDPNPWRTYFDWPGAQCIAVDPDDSPLTLHGSWHMVGVEQAHYEFFRAGGTLGGREGGDWEDVEIDERGKFVQQVLMRLKENVKTDVTKLFEAQDFRVDLSKADAKLLHQAIQLHAISESLSSRGHGDQALHIWTQAAEALRKVSKAEDAEVAQAARLKLGSMLHQVILRRMDAGDLAGALVAGQEALGMLKPAPAPEGGIPNAPALSPLSVQMSVMMRSEYGRCLNNLGRAQFGQGQSEAARQLFKEAISVDRTLLAETDDAQLELARALQNYSAASLSLGEKRQAFESAREAIELCREAASREDPASLRTRRGALNSLQAALIALSEFDKAVEVSIELVEHAFHTMHIAPELVGEFELDPLRALTPYTTGGCYSIARDVVDKTIEGYGAILPSDPVLFTDLLAKAHFVRAVMAAAEQRHDEVAESAFTAASTLYTYKSLLYGGSKDKFVESEYHEAFQQYVDMFHSAMIQAGRTAEVVAKLAELDMRPAPTEGAAADVYLLMEAATTACNAFLGTPSEATRATAQAAINRVESFFSLHSGHADLADLEREWERMMAQLGRTGGWSFRASHDQEGR